MVVSIDDPGVRDGLPRGAIIWSMARVALRSAQTCVILQGLGSRTTRFFMPQEGMPPADGPENRVCTNARLFTLSGNAAGL